MKYIYKKQLPLIRLKLNEKIEVEISDNYDPIALFSDPLIRCTPAALEKMLEEGFLGEITPREFQLGIANNGDGAFAICLPSDKTYQYNTRLAGVKEIIKVREVIE